MHGFNVEKAPLKAPSSIWPQRDVAQPSTSGCRNTGCSKSHIYTRGSLSNVTRKENNDPQHDMNR